MPDTRILVTGADGFVGSHLIEYLQSAGYSEIFATTYSHSEWLSSHLPSDHVIAGDLTNSDHVFKLIEDVKPDWIVHLASLAFVGGSFEKTQFVMDTNMHIQIVMLEAMKKFAPSARMLSIGSATCYGLVPDHLDPKKVSEEYPFFPNSPYAVSKLSQEHLAHMYHLAFGLDIVRVRPFNQIGPRQTSDFVVPAFAQQIVAIENGESGPLKVGNLEAVRDFTDVRDAVRAYERLLIAGDAKEVYNLGSGHGIKIQEVLDTLIELSGADIMIEQDPERMRPSDMPVFVADATKLRSLDWSPENDLRKTLQDVLEYERKKLQ